MLTHENVNLTANDYYTIMTQKNLSFNAHFHKAIELCFMISGSADFIIDGKKYNLDEGECIIVMPDQVHSIHTPRFSVVKIIRFWPELVGSFYSEYSNKIPKNPKFTVNNNIHITEEHIAIKNLYTLKGLVYTLLSDLCYECHEWTERDSGGSIIEEMLSFIDNNFSSDISLKSVSAALNYNYSYISRKFHEFIGMSFNDYLHNCRVNNACLLLKNTKLSISEIAHETGFSSIRSFNRNFIKYNRVTPSQYRMNSTSKAAGN